MAKVTRPWIKILAWALLIVGLVLFVNNTEALTNGDAVECDGDPMSPGRYCVRIGDESLSYDEEKQKEAREELVAYTGIGLGALGIGLFTSYGIARRRR